MPGGIYPGGSLKCYVPSCYTFNTNLGRDLSGDTGSSMNMPDLNCPPNNELYPVQSGQFTEANRPKLWTDGMGFADQSARRQ